MGVLWAGNAVIAHDDPFNRWTAANAGLFFRDERECAARIAAVSDQPEHLPALRRAARRKAAADFSGPAIVASYERLCRAVADPAGVDARDVRWPRGSR